MNKWCNENRKTVKCVAGQTANKSFFGFVKIGRMVKSKPMNSKKNKCNISMIKHKRIECQKKVK